MLHSTQPFMSLTLPLLDLLKATYEFSDPRLMPTNTDSTTPYQPPLRPEPNRLPAFVVHAPTLVPNVLDTLASTFDKDIQNKIIDPHKIGQFCNLKAQLA